MDSDSASLSGEIGRIMHGNFWLEIDSAQSSCRLPLWLFPQFASSDFLHLVPKCYNRIQTFFRGSGFDCWANSNVSEYLYVCPNSDCFAASTSLFRNTKVGIQRMIRMIYKLSFTRNLAWLFAIFFFCLIQ